MITNRLVLGVMLGWFLLTNGILAQEGQRIERTAKIIGVGGGLEAHIDLGSVGTGERLRASIKLMNQTMNELPILKMTTSCSCIKVKSLENSIPAEGSVELELVLTAPKDAHQPTNTNSFSLYYTDERPISVFVEFTLANMVSFRNSHSFHATAPLDVRKFDFRIPVLVTSPARLSNLKIETSDTLAGLKTKLTEDADGQQWLDCTLPIIDDKRFTRIGAVTMSDPKSGNSASLQLIAEVSSGFEFVPSKLRFVRQSASAMANLESPEVAEYKSSGILRIDSLLLASSDRNQKNTNDPRITFGKSPRLTASAKKISTGIYRVELKYRGDPVQANEPSHIECEIAVADRVLRKSIVVDFDSSFVNPQERK